MRAFPFTANRHAVFPLCLTILTPVHACFFRDTAPPNDPKDAATTVSGSPLDDKKQPSEIKEASPKKNETPTEREKLRPENLQSPPGPNEPATDHEERPSKKGEPSPVVSKSKPEATSSNPAEPLSKPKGEGFNVKAPVTTRGAAVAADPMGSIALTLIVAALGVVLGMLSIILAILASGRLQKLEILVNRASLPAFNPASVQDTLLQSRSFQDKLTLSIRAAVRQELAEREMLPLAPGAIRDIGRGSNPASTSADAAPPFVLSPTRIREPDGSPSQKTRNTIEASLRERDREPNRDLVGVLRALASELDTGDFVADYEDFAKLELTDILRHFDSRVSASECQDWLSQLNLFFANSDDPVLRAGHFLRLSPLRSDTGAANVRVQVKAKAIKPLIQESLRRSGGWK